MTLLTLPLTLADIVRTSHFNFVVTGANGWLGRATLDTLYFALGEDFARRVTAIGSRSSRMTLGNGHVCPVYSLREWQPHKGLRSIVFHYAFLTKDRVGSISEQQYMDSNREIGDKVRHWVTAGSVSTLVLSSSGAVYDYLNETSRNSEAVLYGQQKYGDEIEFRAACEEVGTRLIIPRIFSLSGPYINKFDLYAIASLISQIHQSLHPSIRASHFVYRSYYFIGDLIELCLNLSLCQPSISYECFDVAGSEIVEVEELAQRISKVLSDLSPKPIQRPPISHDASIDSYLGNRTRLDALERRFGLQPLKLDAQIFATSQYIEHCLRSGSAQTAASNA